MHHQDKPCCMVNRNISGVNTNLLSSSVAGLSNIGSINNMVRLGGYFLMGTNDRDQVHGDGEGPVTEVHLSDYYMDSTAVSNQEFSRFVDATGYVTEAETFGWSFVFNKLVSDELAAGVNQAVADAPWWWRIDEARWYRPEGPDSTIEKRMDHPVVHVSWNDASAYAIWMGKRLPTEAEWEFSSRGGLAQKRYPWGDTLTPGGQHKCNIWQGNFPEYNSEKDGFFGTAPVKAFDPNKYGMYNVSGNVWEWCSDWFAKRTKSAAPVIDPKGSTVGDSKVTKGGSYLCHSSYCNRYRVSARTGATPDSSAGNIGFRCAADAS